MGDAKSVSQGHSSYGDTPLENLKTFKVREWYDKGFVKCASRIASDYVARNEIGKGGVVTEGASISKTALSLTTTAMSGSLNGINFKIAAISDTDLLVEAGAVGQAIWATGGDEGTTSISLAAAAGPAATTAYVTLIVANSDGSAGANADDDDTDGVIIAVIACDPDTTEGSEDYTDASDFLTSKQIQDALDASDEHSGLTGWVHLAEVAWTVASDDTTVSTSIEMNRNNVVSKA